MGKSSSRNISIINDDADPVFYWYVWQPKNIESVSILIFLILFTIDFSATPSENKKKSDLHGWWCVSQDICMSGSHDVILNLFCWFVPAE